MSAKDWSSEIENVFSHRSVTVFLILDRSQVVIVAGNSRGSGTFFGRKFVRQVGHNRAGKGTRPLRRERLPLLHQQVTGLVEFDHHFDDFSKRRL